MSRPRSPGDGSAQARPRSPGAQPSRPTTADSERETRAAQTGKSMFGPQVISSRASAPSFGFGTAPREPPKTYMGPAHAKDVVDLALPGPDRYDISSSIGVRQRLSNYASAPALGFGTTRRFNTDDYRGRAGPGPAAYAVRASAVGSQLVSTKVSSAAYGFGSATREHTSRVFISRTHARTASVRPDGPGPANAHAFVGAIGRPESVHAVRSSQFGIDTRFKYAAETKRAAATPGPGAYNAHPAVGRQMTSKQRSSAAYGFGSSDRRHAGKVFISSEHAKIVNVDASPGPASVSLPSAFGKSSSTRAHTSNSWSFSKADRFGYEALRAKATGSSPGPGSYSV